MPCRILPYRVPAKWRKPTPFSFRETKRAGLQARIGEFDGDPHPRTREDGFAEIVAQRGSNVMEASRAKFFSPKLSMLFYVVSGVRSRCTLPLSWSHSERRNEAEAPNIPSPAIGRLKRF